jgi:hypothetical protein
VERRPLILDDYRTTLIERLKSCLSTAEARAILTEADLVLTNSRLTPLTRDKFWETLQEDLQTLGLEAGALSDREARSKVEAVVAAAQARIARYRERAT